MPEICAIENCNRPVRAKGICVFHYDKRRLETAAPCSVDGCQKIAEKRSLCGAHYYRLRMHGSPKLGRTENGVAGSFLRNFHDPDIDECVKWPFSENGNGYGAKLAGFGYPHRFICKKFHGSPPSRRHEVAHGCGNRMCINPRHLRWATSVENNADKLRHGTMNRGEKCGVSKITEAEALQIKRLGNISASERREKSKLYGISQNQIYQIITGRSWAWLEV